MNLCCLVNPAYICHRCKEVWCADHFYVVWSVEGHSHQYLRQCESYTLKNVYKCPVAKEVIIGEDILPYGR